jgi:uncharacterized membrane protein
MIPPIVLWFGIKKDNNWLKILAFILSLTPLRFSIIMIFIPFCYIGAIFANYKNDNDLSKIFLSFVFGISIIIVIFIALLFFSSFPSYI